MKWLPTVMLLLVCLSALPQPVRLWHVDSLEKKLKATKSDKNKINILQNLFFAYLSSDSKKALKIAETGLAISQKLKKDSSICDFYDEMGEAYFYMENAKSGINYLNKDYQLAEKIGYKTAVAVSLGDMSGIYESQGDYAKSQDCAFKSLSISEQLKDYRQMAVCNLNIGVTYNNQSNYDKAIYYGKKTLEIEKKTTSRDIEPHAYELIGTAYGSQSKYTEARKYLNMALAIYKNAKNNYGMATIYFLLVGNNAGNHQKQIEIALKDAELWNKIAPDNFYALNNLGDLGSIYGQMAIHEKKQAKRDASFKKAELYLLKAINTAKRTNTKSVIVDYSDSLAVIEAAENKYKNAYSFLLGHNKLYDSIYSQESKNKIASLEGKHEIELRDKQLLINQLEFGNQRKQRWFLIGGLLTLLVISGLIYYQNMQRKKTNTTLLHLNTELDEANKVKTRFFSILNHDLRSPVASFVNFLHLQQQAPDLMDEAAQAAYSKKATESAENLLNTMEDLLLWSKGQMENFKPSSRLIPVHELFDYIQTATAPPANIRISFEQQPGMALNIDEHYMKTIMYNLTNNAIKALGNTGEGNIAWKAWTDGEQRYLSITDNGPGATKEAFRALYDDSAPIGIKSGLGLHIIRDLAKAIGCIISVESKPGSGAELKLKFA